MNQQHEESCPPVLLKMEKAEDEADFVFLCDTPKTL